MSEIQRDPLILGIDALSPSEQAEIAWWNSESEKLHDMLSKCVVAIHAVHQSRDAVCDDPLPSVRFDVDVRVISAFVARIRGAVLLVTAAHAAERLLHLPRESRVLVKAGIQTGVSVGGSHPPVPADIAGWPRLIVFEFDRGLDYAAWLLPLSTVKALERRGIRAFPETQIASELVEGELVALTGYPTGVQSSEFHVGEIQSEMAYKYGAPLLPGRITHSPPSDLQKEHPRVYAQLLARDVPIGGMSGGPLFAIRREDGFVVPRLIGIQSSWGPATKTIAACSVNPLFEYVGKRMDEIAGRNRALFPIATRSTPATRLRTSCGGVDPRANDS